MPHGMYEMKEDLKRESVDFRMTLLYMGLVFSAALTGFSLMVVFYASRVEAPWVAGSALIVALVGIVSMIFLVSKFFEEGVQYDLGRSGQLTVSTWFRFGVAVSATVIVMSFYVERPEFATIGFALALPLRTRRPNLE